jgi:hypothetical protein
MSSLADVIGAGAERDPLLEDVGAGETAIDAGSEYPCGIETCAYCTVLFTRDCEGGGNGLFIHGVLSQWGFGLCYQALQANWVCFSIFVFFPYIPSLFPIPLFLCFRCSALGWLLMEGNFCRRS